MFSYVSLTSHLEIVENTLCLEEFRHARAAAAAMCTLPHFLQGMVGLAGAQTLLKQFEVSAKVALQAPLDRNVKKPLVLKGFCMRAGTDFSTFLGEKVMCFHMFSWHRILKLCKSLSVWKDFDVRARRPRRCALCVIFCKG